ncbi:uncharacterized protein H6S33_006331 [Morchella sextelata]|uniref:uncharacterized protein n=1 Tax=Morchella sextelata TaxID=1174677 RepID=UPI001D048862|nr:uncharacterized protein H6S33_006331 [Morchella sextelata]KAH0604663.1 hypothetical protein H6S33_006331 [Morchella sextelata]
MRFSLRRSRDLAILEYTQYTYRWNQGIHMRSLLEFLELKSLGSMGTAAAAQAPSAIPEIENQKTINVFYAIFMGSETLA